MEAFFTTEIIASFITLSFLEIVLGIDNLIFIALVADSLPKQSRAKVRAIGLGLALFMRVGMLFSITWIMTLTEPVFTVSEQGFSVRDLLLLAGGVFLIGKSTLEMHAEVVDKHAERKIQGASAFWMAVAQIVVIDFVFSFDSILTAVGLSSNLPVMIAAVVVSMVVMLVASDYISRLLNQYPTFKMLALAFILLIGAMLTAEGMGVHIPRGYIYFGFSFSMCIEVLNNIARAKRKKSDRTLH